VSEYMMDVFVEQVTRILGNHIISDIAKTQAIDAMCQGWKAAVSKYRSIDVVSQEMRYPMGIQLFTDRQLQARDRTKDARITELEDAVNADVKMLSECYEKIRQLAEERDNLINRLEASEQRADEHYAQILTLEREHAEKVQTLEQINGDLLTMRDETLTFLHTITTGKNIRTDKPGGRALLDSANALLALYGVRGELVK